MLRQDKGNASAPQPLYRQIKDYILAHVRSGEWPAGTRVPSENQLVRQLGVSRMTINRALRELMQEGFLSRLHGVGTFVKDPPHQTSLLELRNIAQEIRDRGNEHKAVVVLREEIIAPNNLALRFETAPGSTLFHMVLVHLENGSPVQIEDRHVNPAIAPHFLEQDFTARTPTEYLVSVAPVGELEHVVQASLPSPSQQELLYIDAAEPCLVLNRRSWSWDRVASVVALIYPAKRYELRGRYRTSPTGDLATPDAVTRHGSHEPHKSIKTEQISKRPIGPV